MTVGDCLGRHVAPVDNTRLSHACLYYHHWVMRGLSVYSLCAQLSISAHTGGILGMSHTWDEWPDKKKVVGLLKMRTRQKKTYIPWRKKMRILTWKKNRTRGIFVVFSYFDIKSRIFCWPLRNFVTVGKYADSSTNNLSQESAILFRFPYYG